MMNKYIRFFLVSALCLFASGCNTAPKVSKWADIEGLPKQFAVYGEVFWNERSSRKLRKFIAESGSLFKGKTVYDIGTGTGIYALLAIHAGSKYVVATDIDRDSVLNARFNAGHFGVEDKIDIRLVSENTPEAYSVLKEGERFDLIISGPPWGSGKPQNVKERQHLDEDYILLKSMLKDLRRHLNPGGNAFLLIGNANAVKLIKDLAGRQHLKTEILDENSDGAFVEVSGADYILPVIIKITPI